MELTFIRHGHIERGADIASANNPPLSPLGQRQIERLVLATSRWRPPTEILVSPTARTRQTARPLCERFGLEPTIVAWLEEIHAGASRDEPGFAGSDTATQIASGSLADARNGVESFDAFHDRVTTGLIATLTERGAEPCRDEQPPTRWKVKRDDACLLFVGHGGSNAVAVELLLGVRTVPWAWYRFPFAHTAVARLKSFSTGDGDVFGLLKLNHLSHLPQDLRSA